jgi:hypothetical protein
MRRTVAIGDVVTVELPWSEVCMHMRVAGKRMNVQVLSHRSAQLLNDDGTPFSFPILAVEAGIYQDKDGLFVVDA